MAFLLNLKIKHAYNSSRRLTKFHGESSGSDDLFKESWSKDFSSLILFPRNDRASWSKFHKQEWKILKSNI